MDGTIALVHGEATPIVSVSRVRCDQIAQDLTGPFLLGDRVGCLVLIVEEAFPNIDQSLCQDKSVIRGPQSLCIGRLGHEQGLPSSSECPVHVAEGSERISES